MNGLNARMRGPAPARVSREICFALRRMRDPKRARGVQQYFKHEILALGIIDNWALVDGFCGSVLSPLLERHPEVEKTLVSWSRAGSMWLRRAALVTLVPFARRGLFLDATYRLAREHFADPEDLMHKATGWLLREAGKTDMPRLKRFLLQHGPIIPRTALRYAIERFPAVERAELLQTTRPNSNARKVP